MTQEYEANSEIQVTAFTLGRLFESLDKIGIFAQAEIVRHSGKFTKNERNRGRI